MLLESDRDKSLSNIEARGHLLRLQIVEMWAQVAWALVCNPICSPRRTKAPYVILSAAKDQPPVFDCIYCCTTVPLAASIPCVEDSDLPT